MNEKPGPPAAATARVPSRPRRSDATGGNQLPWPYQFGFAVALTVLFVVLVVFMLESAGGSPDQWKNLAYVFGSVEALVFTAIGWVFGREVQRGRVQDAKDEAGKQSAKADAAQADAARQQSAVAELATGIRIATAGDGETTGEAGAEDVGLDDRTPAGPGRSSPAVAELRALADRLHPPGRPYG